MSRTPEAVVKDKIRKHLKAIPAVWHYCPVQMGMGVAGVPDILGCWEGRFFAVEVKAPGKIDQLRAAQEFQIAAIRQANGVAWVTDNADIFIPFFEAWREG